MAMNWREKKDIYEYLQEIAETLGELKEQIEGLAGCFDLDEDE